MADVVPVLLGELIPKRIVGSRQALLIPEIAVAVQELKEHAAGLMIAVALLLEDAKAIKPDQKPHQSPQHSVYCLCWRRAHHLPQEALMDC